MRAYRCSLLGAGCGALNNKCVSFGRTANVGALKQVNIPAEANKWLRALR